MLSTIAYAVLGIIAVGIAIGILVLLVKILLFLLMLFLKSLAIIVPSLPAILGIGGGILLAIDGKEGAGVVAGVVGIIVQIIIIAIEWAEGIFDFFDEIADKIEELGEFFSLPWTNREHYPLPNSVINPPRRTPNLEINPLLKPASPLLKPLTPEMKIPPRQPNPPTNPILRTPNFEIKNPSRLLNPAPPPVKPLIPEIKNPPRLQDLNIKPPSYVKFPTLPSTILPNGWRKCKNCNYIAEFFAFGVCPNCGSKQ